MSLLWPPGNRAVQRPALVGRVVEGVSFVEPSELSLPGSASSASTSDRACRQYSSDRPSGRPSFSQSAYARSRTRSSIDFWGSATILSSTFRFGPDFACNARRECRFALRKTAGFGRRTWLPSGPRLEGCRGYGPPLDTHNPRHGGRDATATRQDLEALIITRDRVTALPLRSNVISKSVGHRRLGCEGDIAAE
jgi:hypothetical protein